MAAMRGFFAFGICFALLANVWYQHYRFFRRYALETPWAVVLNCALLFFVLFYVYPLKFVFTAMLERSEIEVAEARGRCTRSGVSAMRPCLAFSLCCICMPGAYVRNWS